MPETKRDNRIVIVGAGPGGLATGMLLAHAGFDVTIVEQGPEVGGRSGRLRLGDYRFDVGSTILMMKFVLDQLFERVGRSTADYCRFHRLDPLYRLSFGDRSVELSPDHAASEASIEAAFPGEGAGLRRFLNREGRRLDRLYPCLQKHYDGLGDLLDPAVLRAGLHINAHRSLHATMGDYFGDERLRLAFSFQSAYLGMSPWDCPGGFGIIPYVEHAWGIYHVQGGISAICRAMARVVGEEGGRILTSTRVRRVLTRGGRCRGVELQDGSVVEADEVVLNADLAYAANRLFEPGVLRRHAPARLERMKYSCSTFMLYLGLDRPVDLPHHTFSFAGSYRREMAAVFREGTVSPDMSLYVCNPSVTDPTLAPAGHSALYALALVPNLQTGRVDWDSQAEQVRGWMLERLSGLVPGLDLRRHLQRAAMITPQGWARGLKVHHGAVFNFRHDLSQLMVFRPPCRLPELANAWVTGGGTSPGSGLPTILESGRMVASRILQRHGLPALAPGALPAHGVDEGSRLSLRAGDALGVAGL